MTRITKIAVSIKYGESINSIIEGLKEIAKQYDNATLDDNNGDELTFKTNTGFNEEEVIQTVREAAKTKRHAIVIVSEHVTDINALTKSINDKTYAPVFNKRNYKFLGGINNGNEINNS